MIKRHLTFATSLFVGLFMLVSVPNYSYAEVSKETQAIINEAEQGDAEAQYNLAVAYDMGDGIDVDHAKAVFWYQKSADQGYKDAMFNLAVSYDDGEGVEEDNELAVFWYTKAAEKGDADAQNNLAVMYEDGEGTEVDYDQARIWYTKSAQQGNSLAQYNLADLYYNGRGLPQPDKVEAYAWFAVAAENDETGAEDRRKGVWRELNKEQRSDARELSTKYIDEYTYME